MRHMRPNKVKHKLEHGEIANVVSGKHTTSDIIEELGVLGFDAAWLEAEHGPVDFADIPDLTRACDLWDMTSIVRVNLNLPGVIYRTLDLGAQGIVVPHVNTVEEARAVVESTKFGPIGTRGSYTSRQGLGVETYFQEANEETLVIVLIEDIIAVENLDEILTVDHIDVFFVAPGDLAQTMGHLGEPRHPEVLATVDKAIDKIQASGRVPGARVTDESVESYIDKGARFLFTDWNAWIDKGANGFLDKINSKIDSMK